MRDLPSRAPCRPARALAACQQLRSDHHERTRTLWRRLQPGASDGLLEERSLGLTGDRRHYASAEPHAQPAQRHHGAGRRAQSRCPLAGALDGAVRRLAVVGGNMGSRVACGPARLPTTAGPGGLAAAAATSAACPAARPFAHPCHRRRLLQCAIYGNFSAPKVHEIVVGRGKVLELLRPDDAGRVQVVHSTEVFGVIRSLAPFRCCCWACLRCCYGGVSRDCAACLQATWGLDGCGELAAVAAGLGLPRLPKHGLPGSCQRHFPTRLPQVPGRAAGLCDLRQRQRAHRDPAVQQGEELLHQGAPGDVWQVGVQVRIFFCWADC